MLISRLFSMTSVALLVALLVLIDGGVRAKEIGALQRTLAAMAKSQSGVRPDQNRLNQIPDERYGVKGVDHYSFGRKIEIENDDQSIGSGQRSDSGEVVADNSIKLEANATLANTVGQQHEW